MSPRIILSIVALAGAILAYLLIARTTSDSPNESRALQPATVPEATVVIPATGSTSSPAASRYNEPAAAGAAREDIDSAQGPGDATAVGFGSSVPGSNQHPGSSTTLAPQSMTGGPGASVPVSSNGQIVQQPPSAGENRIPTVAPEVSGSGDTGVNGDVGLAPEDEALDFEYSAPEAGVPQIMGPAPEASDPGVTGPAPEESVPEPGQ